MFDIGGGKSLWQGIYTSVRPAWKIFFNVDMANKPAYEEQGGYIFKDHLAMSSSH